MPKSVILEVDKGRVVATLTAFFQRLLEEGTVDALLLPQQLPSQNNVVQTLVTSPEMLQTSAPLAPVLPVNSARIVSAITRVAPSQRRIGVVAKPCELRALVELVKLKQASLENLLLIGVDCFGTCSVNDYIKLIQEGHSPTEEILSKEGGKLPLREACQVCEYPYPLYSDLVIGLIGMDWEKSILLQANTAEGEGVLETMGFEEGEAVAKERESAISELVAGRIKRRDELFERISEQCYGLEKLLDTFAPCISCHNCRDVCPICYCKECFLDSPTFEWEADKYLSWAEKRKGALRMPTDTLLFHLTRLNHMSISCVGCGLCREGCPNDIPVFAIFRWIGSKVQKLFDYIPGRNPEEELPLVTFSETELQEVGYR